MPNEGGKSPAGATSGQEGILLLNPIETQNVNDCLTYLLNTLVNLTAFK